MKTSDHPRGPCPCGSHMAYARCCWPWHAGEAAPDAERLMRSRYAAYVLKLEDYLLATWHPRTKPAALDLADAPTRWLGLKVLRHEAADDDTAIVEFVARYKAGGRTQDFREVSRFVREHGRWLYIDGAVQFGA
jgi:SEC-C motif domain protein